MIEGLKFWHERVSHWSYHENILAVFIPRLDCYPHLIWHWWSNQLRYLGVMENAYANNRELPEKENLSVLTSLDSVSVMMPWLQVMTKTNKNSCLNKEFVGSPNFRVQTLIWLRHSWIRLPVMVLTALPSTCWPKPQAGFLHIGCTPHHPVTGKKLLMVFKVRFWLHSDWSNLGHEPTPRIIYI